MPTLLSWLHDPLTDRRVRLATQRAERPNDFAKSGETDGCPFCAGAEDRTPTEVDRVEGDDAAWLTRVVPNRYPAVADDEGAHEVVIESPRHAQRYVDLTEDEAIGAVTEWSRRVGHWSANAAFDYTLLFKNEGPAAGASLRHVHSQVLALPAAPQPVAAMWRRLADGANASPRTVWSEGGYLVESPAAPRGPEAWLRSDEGVPFARLAEDRSAASRFAGLLRRVLVALDLSAFNLVLQTPPASFGEALAGRWWLEIVPRDSSIAGFELATGLWISSTPPEKAAQRLAERLATLG
ncbi:galactose-1-phosphate uridylyltransferase [Planctomycetes bacterium MalM25]|nr:galactose-1-phosphate uridylyltransferase [Planctomycetes bacterium MalM25]